MTRERIHFLFLNIGHFLDHLFTLIFATVAALALTREWGLSYGELVPYATPGFVAFASSCRIEEAMEPATRMRSISLAVLMGMRWRKDTGKADMKVKREPRRTGTAKGSWRTPRHGVPSHRNGAVYPSCQNAR